MPSRLFIIFPLFLLSELSMVHAQTVERFYDYYGKPSSVEDARFYSAMKWEDSVWHRKDYFLGTKTLHMEGFFLDSLAKVQHGNFHYYFANGKLSRSGRYAHKKAEGLWLSYHTNGMMKDSITYSQGRVTGLKMGWHSNGMIADSSTWNINGNGIEISWFDNGVPSSIELFRSSRLQGRSRYFHRNGQLAALENYEKGKLIARQYYGEDGNEIADTTNRDRPAVFGKGLEDWKAYLGKNLYFPNDYKITGTKKVTVLIKAVIDEDGNLTEPEIEVPFHPSFDTIALKILRKSPKWKPAISHNRRVKYYIRQPVTFHQ